MLTTYDWIYGSCQIGAVVLSIIAGITAVSMLKESRKKSLRAWKYLLWALIFFMLEEILGAMKTFGIWSTPWLTHVLPGVILAFLIAALITQIQVTKGYD